MGEDFPEAKERGARCTWRTEATSNAGIGKIRPVPEGCCENHAMLRCQP